VDVFLQRPGDQAGHDPGLPPTDQQPRGKSPQATERQPPSTKAVFGQPLTLPGELVSQWRPNPLTSSVSWPQQSPLPQASLAHTRKWPPSLLIGACSWQAWFTCKKAGVVPPGPCLFRPIQGGPARLLVLRHRGRRPSRVSQRGSAEAAPGGSRGQACGSSPERSSSSLADYALSLAVALAWGGACRGRQCGSDYRENPPIHVQ
jgi:hypothetical protein